MRISLLIIGAFQLIAASQALAFQFSPMVAELKPEGEGSTQSFTLENTRNHKVAIQVEARTRVVGPDGKESREPTKDFMIFPSQLSLEAGEKRNIRVTWRGDKNPPGELPFRLVATELPVDFNPEKKNAQGVQVNFLIQYIASIYVKPARAQARVVVESVERKQDGKIELKLKNRGTAHQLLNSAKVTIRRAGGSEADEAAKRWEVVSHKPLEGENLLPGNERVFLLSVPTDAPKSGPLEAEIHLSN